MDGKEVWLKLCRLFLIWRIPNFCAFTSLSKFQHTCWSFLGNFLSPPMITCFAANSCQQLSATAMTAPTPLQLLDFVLLAIFSFLSFDCWLHLLAALLAALKIMPICCFYHWFIITFVLCSCFPCFVTTLLFVVAFSLFVLVSLFIVASIILHLLLLLYMLWSLLVTEMPFAYFVV